MKINDIDQILFREHHKAKYCGEYISLNKMIYVCRNA